MDLKNKFTGQTNMLDDVEQTANWSIARNEEIANDSFEVSENNMPALVKVICGGKDYISKLDIANKEKYTSYFVKNKKRVKSLTLVDETEKSVTAENSIIAIASGTAFVALGAAGAATAMPTALIAGLGGAVGMGVIIATPILWPIGISAALFSATKIFKKTRLDGKKRASADKLEKIFIHAQEKVQDCYEKIKVNSDKMQEIISEKLEKSLDTIADISKKVAINIDDIVNSDQNTRIMQFQEIVLKQHNIQCEMQDILTELTNSYNKLIAENEKLKQQIASYEANMRILICANNYLD